MVRIKMTKKGEYVKFKNFKRKIKPQFMIYIHFESILTPEDNGKQNPKESYTVILVDVDDYFNKHFLSLTQVKIQFIILSIV